MQLFLWPCPDVFLIGIRLVRKIDVRILPTTALIYLLCYLDRSNIGTIQSFKKVAAVSHTHNLYRQC